MHAEMAKCQQTMSSEWRACIKSPLASRREHRLALGTPERRVLCRGWHAGPSFLRRECGIGRKWYLSAQDRGPPRE